MIYYEDHEIKIREIRREDVPSLFSWSIDGELNKHDPRPLPSNTEELLEACAAYCARMDTEVLCEGERKYQYFMIVNKEQEPIGFVNFFSINREKKQGEMGITIGDKRYWRKGIAYTAVKQVVENIFDNLDIERITIETGEGNLPALKLFEKLHFQKCGEYMEEEHFKFIIMEKRRDSLV